MIRAPWLGTGAAAVDLFTPAVVPAHPAVIAIALLLQRLQQVAPIRFAAATVLEPASEFGRTAMDELHQQTVNLLNFQPVPHGIYDAQIAFNLLGGMGVCLTWKRGFAVTMKRSPPAAGRPWPCRSFTRRSSMALRFPLPSSSSGPWKLSPWKKR